MKVKVKKIEMKKKKTGMSLTVFVVVVEDSHGRIREEKRRKKNRTELGLSSMFIASPVVLWGDVSQVPRYLA